MKTILKPLWLISFTLALIVTYGCASTGSQGPPGPPGTSTGTVNGVVTNSLTGKPLAAVQVVLDPAIPGITITTDTSGKYSATLPIGVYALKFQKTNFTTLSQTVSLVAGQTFTKNASLQPTARVIASAGNDVESQPGATVTLTASADTLDDSTINSYQWTQTSGVITRINNPAAKSTQITLNTLPVYKQYFTDLLVKLERFEVQAINPLVLEEGQTCTFQVSIVTTSGTYTSTVNVTIALPFVVSTGLENVPIGLPVLLQGKTQSNYDWILTTPADSKAKLSDAFTRFPYFAPDAAGTYIVTEQTTSASLNIYAGTWQGAITGMDSNGLPLTAVCTSCHDMVIKAAARFDSWNKSGHAEIFTENLNTSTHYSEDCFSCHTVGFDKTVDNNGFDDAPDYSAFLSAGLLNKPDPNNWKTMLANYPASASLANIQCENCHGPNNHATLHPDSTPDSARTSISADVCGSCHGEAPRHARFQQWQESGHANFELAFDEGTVEGVGTNAAHCGRCHTGQGFLAWIQQSDLTQRIQGASGNATVTELSALGLTQDEVQPVTCATCHDPHDPGNTSGVPNNTTVRIQGNTPLLPAGFQAWNVGRGAICITCHNTRNGTHNDANPPTSYSAPHVAAQGDVLMGQNAYLVSTGQRSPHANITDSCVNCHMEVTPPPPELSYQLSGTNHTFKASLNICSKCHSNALDANAFQTSYIQQLADLATKMGTYLMNKLPAKVTIKDYTPHTYNNVDFDLKSNATVIDKTNIASIEPTEPHGQIGFIIEFKQAVAFTYAPSGQEPHTLALNQVQVQLGDITTDGTKAVISTTDTLVKAAWNYFLLEGDSSFGIHNPAFINDVLMNSIQALFPVVVPQQP